MLNEEQVLQIKKELVSQKENKYRGSIYYFSQIQFAYNSNRIEGSRLSEEQTEQIFDSNTMFVNDKKDVVRLDDMIETRNHFKLFDYMLDHIDEPLTKEMLIRMNVILKKGTSYEDDEKYNVGGFKVKPNIIGTFNVIHTSDPHDVERDIEKLLERYNSLKNITIEDIVDFHVRYERIHPFGDGNGRTGRMIMFKECLRNNIVPFIVLDRDRPFYIRGLKEYDEEKNYLLETCLHSQDIYESICRQLEIFEDKNIDDEISQEM